MKLSKIPWIHGDMWLNKLRYEGRNRLGLLLLKMSVLRDAIIPVRL